MSEASSEWCTIESDPGVFTELIEGIGVKEVQVEEVYDLDGLEELAPVYGLIFLFKWVSAKDERPVTHSEDVYFAQQVVTNACATQAILSVLMNAPEIDLGAEITDFKNVTAGFPAEGLAMGNHPTIKRVHNSFSRPEPFSIVQTDSGKGDAFHFLSYVPINGKLYELDGLKAGPICLGDCTTADWLQKVTPIIQERMDQYSKSEVHFNLMAVIKNKKVVLEAELSKLRSERDELQKTLSGIGDMDTEEKEGLESRIQAVSDQIENVVGLISGEEAKFANWRAENIRRKHNYIPFLFNLLKVLAEKDLLVPLVERAKEKQRQRQEKK